MNLKKIMLALLAILLLLATELAGQGMSARVTGVVRDEDSRPLGGVLVTAVNTINNSSITAVSGEPDGSFRLLGLVPGIYQVSFDLEGYESYTAAGISLSVEQSVTLRIKLKKTAPPDGQGVVAAEAGAREREDRRDKRDFFAERSKWSLRISFNSRYIALGDSNAFLSGYTKRVNNAHNAFKTLHSAGEVAAEVGWRVSPRLELAVGAGLVNAGRWNNDLQHSSFWYPDWTMGIYTADLNVKSIPVQLTCRYWLASKGSRIYSVYGSVLYHFVSWKMYMDFSNYYTDFDGQWKTIHTWESRTASQRGFGLEAGGRVEWRMDEIFSFVIDLSGRYAPLRHFFGRQQRYNVNKREITESEGELWFYEIYDASLGRWVQELGIGDRPSGTNVRSVSSARVDFSGLALRVGLLFRIGREAKPL